MKFDKHGKYHATNREEADKTLNRRVFLQRSMAAGIAGYVGCNELLASNNPIHESGLDETSMHPYFRVARPIWPTEREKEMNLFVAFTSEFTYVSGSVRVFLAAATLYRLQVNGVFCAFGPARGPHGHFRMDMLDITSHLKTGTNRLVVEVAGYNINSYWTLNQPSFLQAEVLREGAVLAATGHDDSFRATILSQRLQRVQRYSFQRAFSEAYRINYETSRWRDGRWSASSDVTCRVLPQVSLLPRRVPLASYDCWQPAMQTAKGTVRRTSDAKITKPRFITDIGPKLLGFREDELEVLPYIEMQHYSNETSVVSNAPYDPQRGDKLLRNEFYLYDFGIDFSGFIGVSVVVAKPTKLYLTFDETLMDGDVDFTRLSCANVIYYELAPGSYDLETFEPYAMRFLKATVLEGELELRSVMVRTYSSPSGMYARFACSDNGLNRIFLAGRETYRQNAVDLFTDCPSRERAGWLCDSYFTARAAAWLTGDCDVERAFLENYLLPERFLFLPSGMLPMCYPADHYDGQYIANWAMWFVLQLEEYEERTGDRTMIERFRPRLLGLLEHFRKYQNEDGLLENLDGHIFIEWSDANKYIHGVNYPTNMLYAAMLSSFGRLYGDVGLIEAASQLQDHIRAQAFDGKFFVDNALRKNGMLHPTENRSETCQYYAFYFGTVSPETHGDLWQTLCRQFGPSRNTKLIYPTISPSNALVGNVLRLELLTRDAKIVQALRESRDELLYMADRTGTLWEHISPRASLNHAFESHIINVYYRDALGLYHIDALNRHVDLRFAETGLNWCEGSVPTPDGPISLQWTRDNRTIRYRCSLPEGYSIRVSTLNNLEATENTLHA